MRATGRSCGGRSVFLQTASDDNQKGWMPPLFVENRRPQTLTTCKKTCLPSRIARRLVQLLLRRPFLDSIAHVDAGLDCRSASWSVCFCLRFKRHVKLHGPCSASTTNASWD